MLLSASGRCCAKEPHFPKKLLRSRTYAQAARRPARPLSAPNIQDAVQRFSQARLLVHQSTCREPMGSAAGLLGQFSILGHKKKQLNLLFIEALFSRLVGGLFPGLFPETCQNNTPSQKVLSLQTRQAHTNPAYIRTLEYLYPSSGCGDQSQIKQGVKRNPAVFLVNANKQ